MKRLLLRVLAILAVFMVALVMLRNVNGALPSHGLTVIASRECEPRPCWDGIKPGHTKLIEARAMLNEDPTLTIVDGSIYPADLCWLGADAPFWRFCAYRTWNGSGDDLIDRVELEIPYDTLKLGDLVTHYGPPAAWALCWVTNTGRPNVPDRYLAAFITFEGGIVLMAYNTAEPTERVMDPNMMVMKLSYRPNTDTSTSPFMWHGFGKDSSSQFQGCRNYLSR